MRRVALLALLALSFAPFGTEGWAEEAREAPKLAVPPAPAEGGPRRWKVVGEALELRRAPGDDAPVVATLPEATVVAHLGCAADGTSSAAVWCRVRPLRDGPAGFARAERLEPARGPDGMVATGLDGSMRRARRGDADARTEARCAQERGQALGTCEVAVARDVGGDATVVATFPNGFRRLLRFEHGVFVAADATMSGTGRDTDWALEGGVHRLRVDDQRFELDEAFVLGR